MMIMQDKLKNNKTNKQINPEKEWDCKTWSNSKYYDLISICELWSITKNTTSIPKKNNKCLFKYMRGWIIPYANECSLYLTIGSRKKQDQIKPIVHATTVICLTSGNRQLKQPFYLPSTILWQLARMELALFQNKQCPSQKSREVGQ